MSQLVHMGSKRLGPHWKSLIFSLRIQKHLNKKVMSCKPIYKKGQISLDQMCQAHDQADHK